MLCNFCEMVLNCLKNFLKSFSTVYYRNFSKVYWKFFLMCYKNSLHILQNFSRINTMMLREILKEISKKFSGLFVIFENFKRKCCIILALLFQRSITFPVQIFGSHSEKWWENIEIKLVTF